MYCPNAQDIAASAAIAKLTENQVVAALLDLDAEHYAKGKSDFQRREMLEFLMTSSHRVLSADNPLVAAMADEDYECETKPASGTTTKANPTPTEADAPAASSLSTAPAAPSPPSAPLSDAMDRAIRAAVDEIVQIGERETVPPKPNSAAVWNAFKRQEFHPPRARDWCAFTLARHTKGVGYSPMQAPAIVAKFRELLPEHLKQGEHMTAASYAAQFVRAAQVTRAAVGDDPLGAALSAAKRRVADGKITPLAGIEAGSDDAVFVAFLEELQRRTIDEHVHHGTPTEFFLGMSVCAKTLGYSDPHTVANLLFLLQSPAYGGYLQMVSKGYIPKKGVKGKRVASTYCIPSLIDQELTPELIKSGDVYRCASTMTWAQREVLALALVIQTIKRRAGARRYWFWPRIVPEIVETEQWKEIEGLRKWMNDSLAPGDQKRWKNRNFFGFLFWAFHRFEAKLVSTSKAKNKTAEQPLGRTLKQGKLVAQFLDGIKDYPAYCSPSELEHIYAQLCIV